MRIPIAIILGLISIALLSSCTDHEKASYLLSVSATLVDDEHIQRPVLLTNAVLGIEGNKKFTITRQVLTCTLPDGNVVIEAQDGDQSPLIVFDRELFNQYKAASLMLQVTLTRSDDKAVAGDISIPMSLDESGQFMSIMMIEIDETGAIQIAENWHEISGK